MLISDLIIKKRNKAGFMGLINILRYIFQIGIIIIISCSNSFSADKARITQESSGPQSQNIVAGTVNILGLSQPQTELILKRLDRVENIVLRGLTNTEEAKQQIQLIEQELSEIQSTKFDSLPDDAKKWVTEIGARLEAYKKQNSLTEASLKKQMEYREKLSLQIIAKTSNLFAKMFDDIDSRILALEQGETWGISYDRRPDFRLFAERKNTSNTALLVREIRFRNGSSIDVMLIPGGLDRGIIEHCPQLQFLEVIKEQRTLSFSVKEKPGPGAGAGFVLSGPPPLVPPLRKPGFSDLMFDLQQENPFDEEFKTRLLNTFTQFIGSVFSKDDLRKSVPR